LRGGWLSLRGPSRTTRSRHASGIQSTGSQSHCTPATCTTRPERLGFQYWIFPCTESGWMRSLIVGNWRQEHSGNCSPLRLTQRVCHEGKRILLTMCCGTMLLLRRVQRPRCDINLIGDSLTSANSRSHWIRRDAVIGVLDWSANTPRCEQCSVWATILRKPLSFWSCTIIHFLAVMHTDASFADVVDDECGQRTALSHVFARQADVSLVKSAVCSIVSM